MGNVLIWGGLVAGTAIATVGMLDAVDACDSDSGSLEECSNAGFEMNTAVVTGVMTLLILPLVGSIISPSDEEYHELAGRHNELNADQKIYLNLSYKAGSETVVASAGGAFTGL